MPHDPKIEQVVLGALLLESDAIESLQDTGLQPTHFYDLKHQATYQAIHELYVIGGKIDILTVQAQMHKKRPKENLKDLAIHLATLTQKVSSAIHILDHASLLIELAQRRESILLLAQKKALLSNPSKDVKTTIHSLVSDAFALIENSYQDNLAKLDQALSKHIKDLEYRQKNKKPTGISSGLRELDKLMGGWKKGDITVIGARPGMGKTNLLLKFITEASQQTPVLFFSSEMSKTEILNRLIAQKTGIHSDKLRDARLLDQDWKKIMHKGGDLASMPIYLDDTPNIGIEQIQIKSRRLARMQGIQSIFIDYLQLLTAEGERHYRGDKNKEIAEISKKLKGLARALNVPIIVASQLSRAIETRGGAKTPLLSDLRDSGTIEQDASNVIFIHRPSYYGTYTDDDGNDITGAARLIVAKHRHGATGQVTVKFEGQKALFSDFQKSEIKD